MSFLRVNNGETTKLKDGYVQREALRRFFPAVYHDTALSDFHVSDVSPVGISADVVAARSYRAYLILIQRTIVALSYLVEDFHVRGTQQSPLSSKGRPLSAAIIGRCDSTA